MWQPVADIFRLPRPVQPRLRRDVLAVFCCKHGVPLLPVLLAVPFFILPKLVLVGGTQRGIGLKQKLVPKMEG